MMTRETFLAAFDTDRWLTGPDVLAHLEASGFWDPWWRQASQAAKLASVAQVCWRCHDDDGLPFIAAIDRGEGSTRTLMDKPCAALTSEEAQEVRRYFLAMAWYERWAAAIARPWRYGLKVRASCHR
jgi:hypothetical protein